MRSISQIQDIKKFNWSSFYASFVKNNYFNKIQAIFIWFSDVKCKNTYIYIFVFIKNLILCNWKSWQSLIKDFLFIIMHVINVFKHLSSIWKTSWKRPVWIWEKFVSLFIGIIHTQEPINKSLVENASLSKT